MYIYQSTNPCICTNNNPEVDPPCPEDCNCLKLCNISLAATDSLAVGPCAQEGTLNVSDTSWGHDLCACGDTTGYWSIHGFDEDIFITASINATTGVLTWITQGPEALDKQYGSIFIKYCCGQLSAYLTAVIGIKDLCDCPECELCEDCDPCTGLCLDTQVDMSIESVYPETSNNAINVS